MNPKNWQQVKDLFTSALALDSGEREAFLSRACQNDPELRREVESLLASHEAAGDFIESPRVSLKPPSPAPFRDDTVSSGAGASFLPAGHRIGAYQIVRLIGEGGMGAVYLAERADQEYQKRVAIKIIRQGMESDFVVRRFRNERQILADLEHPNIARLIDGGTTLEGTPYFVMEFVEGLPLHQFCDGHRLTVPERLQLFRRVCSAVEYAHQRLVIHRDLKPTNILVLRDRIPKLLDFGIAKVVDPEIDSHGMDTTVGGVRLMTPAYASPEQIRGEPATNRSDIYALGVLLFELVAGRRPARSRGWGMNEVERPSEALLRSKGEKATPQEIARDRQSTVEELRRQLSEGLDEIILRAMDPVPEERYATVDELSQDLRRYLEGAPVTASPFTRASTTGFTSMETQPVSSALAVLPFRMIGSETETDTYLGIGMADALITKLSSIRRVMVRPTSSVSRYATGEIDPVAAGRELSVAHILEGRLRKSKDRVRVTVQLISTQTGTPVWAGQFDEKLDDILNLEDSLSNQVALALLPTLSGEENRSLARRGTNSPRAFQAYLKGRYYWNSYTPEALARALVCFMQAIAEDPNYAQAHAGVADYYNRLGVSGDLPPIESFAAAMDAARKAMEIDPTLAEAHAALAFAHWARREFDLAESEFQVSLSLNPDYVNARHWFALFCSCQGKALLALAEIRRAQALDPLSANLPASLGRILYHAREYERAEEELRQAAEKHPQSAQIHEQLAWCRIHSCRCSEAIQAAEQAVDLSGGGVFCLAAMASALAVNGRRSEAEAVLRRVEERGAENFVSPYALALIHAALGDAAQSAVLLEQAKQQYDWWFNWRDVEPLFAPVTEKTPAASARTSATRIAPAGSGPFTSSVPKPKPYRRRVSRYAGWAALVTVVAAAGIWGVGRALKEPPLFAATRISKLTTNGIATHAALSPDGRYVVYSASEAGGQSLWLRQADIAGSMRIVPRMEGDIRGLKFSRDGSFVSFVNFERGEPSHGVLYRVAVLGGSISRILEDVSGPTSLSPDGANIAAVRVNPGSGVDELIVSKLDGSELRQLAKRKHPDRITWTSDPAWSPDGQRIVTAVEGSDGHGFAVLLMVIRVRDGSSSVLSSPRWQYVEQMAWLADGSGIMVIGQEQDSSYQQIWFVSYPGGVARRVSNDLNDYTGVSLSSSGDALVSVQTQTLTNIWVAPKGDPQHPRQITQGSGRYFDLAWSASGKILYASDASGSADIWRMNADGTDQRVIAAGAGRNYAPDASPDGRWIVFHSNRNGNWNVWRMNGDGGGLRQLTFDTKDSNWPVFTPNSDWVVYHHTGSNATWNIWKVPVAGGSPVQLTDRLATHPAVSPVDGKIACWYSETAEKPNWKIALLAPEGGEPLLQFDFASSVAPDTTLRWTPDGAAITYVGSHAGVQNLWIQPITGGPPKQVTNSTSGQIFSFDWSPNGDLATSRGMTTNDVVLIRDLKQ